MDTRLRIIWNRNTQPDIASYNLFRDGNFTPLATIPHLASPTIEIVDYTLTNGRFYTYEIEAVDLRGNRSGHSATIQLAPVSGTEWGQ